MGAIGPVIKAVETVRLEGFPVSWFVDKGRVPDEQDLFHWGRKLSSIEDIGRLPTYVVLVVYNEVEAIHPIPGLLFSPTTEDFYPIVAPVESPGVFQRVAKELGIVESVSDRLSLVELVRLVVHPVWEETLLVHAALTSVSKKVLN